ncbi:hypothetical protein [Cylindrospermopsis raciborskii]|uniref:hypothetical protein n=1 Tax=Cylindrospermopsis raciborskii TaxID=77022 RepID=UPI0011473682|nr:hypothetical protein [Cylindrospermopsis raciborskii]
MTRIAGDREALHTGDRLPTSSQGKSVNLLLGIGDGILGDREGIVTRRLSVGETGLKAKVGLKPTGFVIL